MARAPVSLPLSLDPGVLPKVYSSSPRRLGHRQPRIWSRDYGKAARSVGPRQPRAFDCIQSLDPNMPIANKDPCEENQEDCAGVPFVLGEILRFSNDLRDFLRGSVFPLLWRNTARSKEPHKDRPPLAQECSFSGVRHAS
jgi:hypothetical protein